MSKTDKPQGFYSDREKDPGNILLDFLPNSTGAILKQRLSYVTKEGFEHTAEPELFTNGGSIPAFAWPIIGPPFRSIYLPAYIIHDAGWEKAAAAEAEIARTIRKIYNDIFPEMLEYLGCDYVKRRTMFRCVQLGGLYRNWRPSDGEESGQQSAGDSEAAS
jgi:hypothetical protein